MKVKVIILISILVFIASEMPAQNLCANNSFETYTSLPAGYGEWYKCSGWSNLNNYVGFAWPYASPDFLHKNGGATVQLPTNTFGTINPHSGNAVMGLVAYYAPSTDFREYLCNHLSAPLVVGNSYTISFYLSNGTNCYSGSGCNHLGIYLSTTQPSQINHEPLTALTPQAEIQTIWFNSTWQLVTFTVTATQPFQYVSIGNFKNDANTLHQNYVGGQDGAYYFIDDVSVSPSTPLPVELLSFKAKPLDSKVELSWTTASEFNSNYFVIERSANGFKFDSIGTVDAIGNSNYILNYSFIDLNPLFGVNFYRINEIDINGEHHLSNIVKVIALVSNTEMNAWYDASSQIINVNKNTDNDICSVDVIDVNGKIVYQTNFKNYYTSFSATKFSNGIYTIRTVTATVSKSVKLIIN